MSESERDLIVYPRYLRTWKESRARSEMTLEERGLYWELLDHCWQFGSLPADVDALKRIAMCKSSREFTRAWKVVRNWFTEKDGRLTHKKVEAERPSVLQRMLERNERYAQAGKKRALTAARGQGGRFSSSSNGTSERWTRWTSDNTSDYQRTTSDAGPATTSDAGHAGRGAGPATTSVISSEQPARARDKNTRNTRHAGPSGLSVPEVLSSPTPSHASGKNREKQKPTAKRNAAPRSRGKAPARRSEKNHNATSAPEPLHITRIVGLNGGNCQVEVQGRNGHEVRSMPISEAEQLLALAKGLAQ